MRRFARLVLGLGETRGTAERIARLAAYFASAPEEDAAWAFALLAGRRPRRAVTTTRLRAWAAEEAGLPEWLVEASYEAVGDLGETLALLLPDALGDDDAESPSLAAVMRDGVLALASARPDDARAIVRRFWRRLDAEERFVYHKLLGGSFRIGVSRGLVLRAVATRAGVDLATITHRASGAFEPTAASWRALLEGGAEDRAAQPYPFCLAQPLVDEPASLGAIDAHLVERKFDGIRAQLIRRGELVALWSRGEERVERSFPEVQAAARRLPEGTVLDGEILVWEGEGERPAPFARLQTRLNATRGVWRREPGLFDRERVVFVAYDLLEASGEDLRTLPLRARRERLDALLATHGDETLRISPSVPVRSWAEAAAARAESRALGVEGLMLKRLDAPYGLGRQRGADGRGGGGWWKWKVDPYAIDAVLVAAEPGHGRRANLLTDYTFAVWRGSELVTIAKAYSGLDDAEIAELDRVLRATTTAKRGPVRIVEPTLVFELGFEGLQRSTRHKAGIALRFPRILRRRSDKPAAEADRMETLEALLAAHAGGAYRVP